MEGGHDASPVRFDLNVACASVIAAAATSTTSSNSSASATPGLPQYWRKEYGGNIDPGPATLDELNVAVSHPTPVTVGGYAKSRGSEFFFTPSLTFLPPQYRSSKSQR